MEGNSHNTDEPGDLYEVDGNVVGGRDSRKGKRSKGYDGISKARKPRIDGSARIFHEKTDIIVSGPHMRARYYNYSNIYAALEEEPKLCEAGISGKSRIIQYHPFFDYDVGNQNAKHVWDADVAIVTAELTRTFGRPPTMFTREERAGVHFWYPELRIASQHLYRVYDRINARISLLLKMLTLDVKVSAFPLPKRSKDGRTYYVDKNGNLEPHPVARGTEPYAHTVFDGDVMLTSVTVWVPPRVYDAVFDAKSVLHTLVARLIEETGGVFFVTQILQQLMYYEASYTGNVYSLLSNMYPDDYPIKMVEFCDLMGWSRPVDGSHVAKRRTVDIFVSMAIRMFRTPDPGLGDETCINAIAKLNFSINGYFMALLKEQAACAAEGENFREFDAAALLPRGDRHDIVENIVVFYNDVKGRVRLFTGSEWAMANREAVTRLLTFVGIDDAAVHSVAARIGGKYCQLHVEDVDGRAVYFTGGGYYLGHTIMRYIDPLDAPAPARVGITFEDMMYVRLSTTRVAIEHILTDDALSGRCECLVCTQPAQQIAQAIAAARYVYLLMCCRGHLARWVIQFFARICFKMLRKQIIVLLGETAGNGKTEFVHVLHTVFGDYLRPLAQSTSTSARKEMAADVKFAEFSTLCVIDDALADENSEDSVMNVTSLKSLTGGGLNFARGLFDAGDGMRELQLNLLYTGNTHMTVPPDRGVFNRLKNIPFKMRFLDNLGLDMADYTRYMSETWPDKVQRIQCDLANPKNGGTAFDAGVAMQRQALGRGLAILFGTIASYPDFPVEAQPVEVDQTYKTPNKRTADAARATKRPRVDHAFDFDN